MSSVLKLSGSFCMFFFRSHWSDLQSDGKLAVMGQAAWAKVLERWMVRELAELMDNNELAAIQ